MDEFSLSMPVCVWKVLIIFVFNVITLTSSVLSCDGSNNTGQFILRCSDRSYKGWDFWISI